MIEFDHVSKRYRLGEHRGSLRDGVASSLGRLFGRGNESSSQPSYHQALSDVTFRIEKGEAFGLVGRNGAGKTTILKLLAGITQPTGGHVKVSGRVGALIELGAGFHPDLTGRDNVYLYGAILGLSRREIDRRYAQIVDFAELPSFMDTPVKRYSSGMYARLAFSVAAHSSPEVLLVDEVLAVGDRNFQDKCLEFIHSYVASGNTTVFVSHNLYAVEQLCHRLIWIDRGQVVLSGNPSQVLEQYMKFMDQEAAEHVERPAAGGKKLNIRRVQVLDAQGCGRSLFECGEDVVVSVDYDTEEPVERPHFCIWISDSIAPNPLFAANMMLDGKAPEVIAGSGSIRCTFREVPLMPRSYYVWVEVWGADRSEILFRWQRLARFEVADSSLLRDADQRKGSVRFSMAHGPIRIPYMWQFGQDDPDWSPLSRELGSGSDSGLIRAERRT